MRKNNIKGTLILLLTALIWGTGFVAQTAGADAMGTFSFNAYRSYIATVVLLLYIVIAALVMGRTAGTSFKEQFLSGWQIKGGIICGIVLTVAMNLQQAGIESYPPEAAASSRAGFLTAMYVVLVGVVSAIKNRRIDFVITGCCVIVAIGLYLLCLSDGIDRIYFGDILCFLCSIAYTVQILVIDKYAAGNCVKLSMIQFFTVAVLSTICAAFMEGNTYFNIDSFAKASFSIFYLGIMSSGVAYTLQMVGQKYAEPAVASITMCLESVFAALSGWIILSERLSIREFIGCALLFVAVIVSQLPDLISERKAHAS